MKYICNMLIAILIIAVSWLFYKINNIEVQAADDYNKTVTILKYQQKLNNYFSNKIDMLERIP